MIIFVYNAESGLFSLLSDFAHKIISPSTYACNLCKLTYGNFLMKEEWRKFIQDINFEKVFLHKDEFYKKYPHLNDKELPAIWFNKNDEMRELVSARELNALDNIDLLKKTLIQRLPL